MKSLHSARAAVHAMDCTRQDFVHPEADQLMRERLRTYQHYAESQSDYRSAMYQAMRDARAYDQALTAAEKEESI